MRKSKWEIRTKWDKLCVLGSFLNGTSFGIIWVDEFVKIFVIAAIIFSTYDKKMKNIYNLLNSVEKINDKWRTWAILNCTVKYATEKKIIKNIKMIVNTMSIIIKAKIVYEIVSEMKSMYHKMKK